MHHHFVVLALASTLALTSSAQLPVVDITMVPSQPDLYEVRIRPDADFDGLFSSLVFSLRWSASSSATLAEFVPSDDMMDIGIYPVLSGDVVVSGGYQYAPHVAFGNSSLAAEGMAWSSGQEIVLGTIQVIGGPTDLVLINDGWTSANNTNFFVSLNGVGRTGVIYSSSTSLEDTGATTFNGSIDVRLCGDRIQVTFDAPSGAVLPYRLVDSAGRLVQQGRLIAGAGASVFITERIRSGVGVFTFWLDAPDGTRHSRTIILQ